MDAKQAIEAMAKATPEQRERIKQVVREGAIKEVLETSGLTLRECNGQWVVTGTPAEWVRFLTEYRG